MAQDRAVPAGGTLVAEEAAKRGKNPFDMWDEMAANAAAGRFPKGTDVFLHKFHGLFYVAPNQDAFMLRLRLPGGILSAYQAQGLADIAERFGGGAVDITTRANLQIREIGAAHPLDVLTAIDELGLTSRGAGADNIRNITASPNSGFDPDELIDVRPYAKGLHHYILNHRDLFGLPRKFNVAFDNGGSISAAADTNDIGFMACRVTVDRMRCRRGGGRPLQRPDRIARCRDRQRLDGEDRRWMPAMLEIDAVDDDRDHGARRDHAGEGVARPAQHELPPPRARRGARSSRPT